MESNHIRIAELINFYLDGTITSEQMEELLYWQQKYPQIREWIEEGESKKLEVQQRYEYYMTNELLSDWEDVSSRNDALKKSKRKREWMIAASILFIFFVGFWMVKQKDYPERASEQAEISASAVMPGKEKAYLTLSDGRTVVLGEEENQIIQEGEIAMNVIDNQLDYSAITSKDVYQHRLNVPIGGTYHLQLSDGTKVWINADSELEFPSSFENEERVVRVKGEAYFEVAKDPSRPFKVKVQGTTVEALGTAFNINTHLYQGLVKTILTEGKVKVSTESGAHVIDAGYATISGADDVRVSKADVEEALAWKEGYFYFNGKNFKEILGEISRWYDVDLRLDVDINDDKYKGGIKRSASIEAICEVLKDLTGYNVKIKNRTLVIE